MPEILTNRDGRGSALLPAIPWRGILPTPDGLVLDRGDRQQTAYLTRMVGEEPYPDLGSERGGSFEFSNDAHLINHGSDSSLDNLSPVTIAAWIRPSITDTTERMVVSKDETRLSILDIGIDTGLLKAFLDYSGDDCQVISGPGFVVQNEWQFVAFVDSGPGELPALYHGTPGSPCIEEDIYTDQTAGTGSRETTDASSDLCIGNKPSTDKAFRGRIASVAIWGRALSVEELRRFQHNMRYAGAGCSVFAAYFGSDASIAWDYSGRRNHGIVIGAQPVMDQPPASIHWYASKRRRRTASIFY